MSRLSAAPGAAGPSGATGVRTQQHSPPGVAQSQPQTFLLLLPQDSNSNNNNNNAANSGSPTATINIKKPSGNDREQVSPPPAPSTPTTTGGNGITPVSGMCGHVIGSPTAAKEAAAAAASAQQSVVPEVSASRVPTAEARTGSNGLALGLNDLFALHWRLQSEGESSQAEGATQVSALPSPLSASSSGVGFRVPVGVRTQDPQTRLMADGEMNVDVLELRRERNRRAQRNYRMRQKKRIEELEHEVRALREKIHSLEIQNAELVREIEVRRAQEEQRVRIDAVYNAEMADAKH